MLRLGITNKSLSDTYVVGPLMVILNLCYMAICDTYVVGIQQQGKHTNLLIRSSLNNMLRGICISDLLYISNYFIRRKISATHMLLGTQLVYVFYFSILTLIYCVMLRRYNYYSPNWFVILQFHNESSFYVLIE